MPRTIHARQRDTVDAICYRIYGRTQGVTEQVLKANPGLADLGPVLPHGTPVTLPDIVQSPSHEPTIQLWS